MFLANNMIHQPFKARLKLALRYFVKFMRPPPILPYQFLLPTIHLCVAMQSVLLVKFQGDELFTKINYRPILPTTILTLL